MALGKVRGPLAALILRVWDGRPERPVDGGCTVVSGEGLPPYVKGLDEFFPPWGPMDQLSLEPPPPRPNSFSLCCWVGVVPTVGLLLLGEGQ